jgi:hypothetical protein
MVPQAFVELNFATNLPATPQVVTNNANVLFNTLTTNKKHQYSLNTTTGALKLKKSGTYSLTFYSTLQNTGSGASVYALYATLNTTVISQNFRSVAVGEVAQVVNTVSFTAKKGDKLYINITYPAGSQFSLPAGLSIQGFTGPVLSNPTSTCFYQVLYLGSDKSSNC